jgi:hypothetical protein
MRPKRCLHSPRAARCSQGHAFPGRAAGRARGAAVGGARTRAPPPSPWVRAPAQSPGSRLVLCVGAIHQQHVRMQRASPVERPAPVHLRGPAHHHLPDANIGSTWSTRWAAPSPIPRRARRLRLNATMSSCPHDEPCTRVKPCSGVPHLRCARKVLGDERREPAVFTRLREERFEVFAHHRAKGRGLRAVPVTATGPLTSRSVPPEWCRWEQRGGSPSLTAPSMSAL